MSQIKITVVGLGAQRRDMTFDDGRNLKDCVLKAINSIEPGENIKGLSVEDYKGAYELYEKFTVLPGKYELTTDWNGKKMTLLDAKFIEKVDVKL